jgi:TPR repeat protein
MERRRPVGAAGFVLALLLWVPLWPSPDALASEGVTTYRNEFVHEPAPGELVAKGDQAAAAQDYAGAMRQYLAASQDNDNKVQGAAFNRIGELYEGGLGVSQGRAESFKWFQKSAATGNPYGQANLGNCYFFGLGTDRNLAEARHWAEQGALAGVAQAINQMGWQSLYGMGVSRDAAEGRRWYEKSAAMGDATGELQLGWIYVHVEPVDYQEGMRWYRKAADQGDEGAQNNIGYLYENGLGVDKDLTEAARWYQTSADAGYARAQFHLGRLYELGLGVSPDAALARSLMQKAAAGGDPEAAQWVLTHGSGHWLRWLLVLGLALIVLLWLKRR